MLNDPLRHLGGLSIEKLKKVRNFTGIIMGITAPYVIFVVTTPGVLAVPILAAIFYIVLLPAFFSTVYFATTSIMLWPEL